MEKVQYSVFILVPHDRKDFVAGLQPKSGVADLLNQDLMRPCIRIRKDQQEDHAGQSGTIRDELGENTHRDRDGRSFERSDGRYRAFLLES